MILDDSAMFHLHLDIFQSSSACIIVQREVPWQGKPVSAGSWAAMLRKLVSALNEGHVCRLSLPDDEAIKIY